MSDTLPTRVFVLVRQSGCYEDYRESPICAYATEGEGTAAVAQAKREWLAACEQFPDPEYPADGSTEAEWEVWEKAGEARCGNFAAMLTLDPGAAPTGGWGTIDTDTDYMVWAIRSAVHSDPVPA